MDSLRKLQLCELEILKKVKEICEKNNLTYYLSGGTLLGAVRHKGFIPWDDDVDVAMPRPDYEKFLRIVNKELINTSYSLLTNEVDNSYLFATARVIDKRIKVETSSRTVKEIWDAWIDIFPLDAMPANRIHFFFRKCHILYRKMMYLYSCFDNVVEVNKKGRPLHERMLMYVAMKLHLDRIMDTPKQIRKFHNVLASYPFDRGAYAINLLGRYKFKSLMEKSVYGKKAELIFEGISLRVPEQYDLYLTRIYGNYMECPPENERSHHMIKIIEDTLREDDLT